MGHRQWPMTHWPIQKLTNDPLCMTHNWPIGITMTKCIQQYFNMQVHTTHVKIVFQQFTESVCSCSPQVQLTELQQFPVFQWFNFHRCWRSRCWSTIFSWRLKPIKWTDGDLHFLNRWQVWHVTCGRLVSYGIRTNLRHITDIRFLDEIYYSFTNLSEEAISIITICNKAKMLQWRIKETCSKTYID